MAFDFKFPDVGEGITEGEIVKWLVKEGDSVKEDDTIAQVETDKAVVDIPSPKTGTILKLNFKEGDKIKVGEVICIIGEAGEKVKSSGKKSKAGKPPTKGKNAGKGSSVVGQLEEADESVEDMFQSNVMKGEQQSAKTLASPTVRKYASEKGVDLSKVKGSGSGGRILKSDIENISGSTEVEGEKKEVPQQKITVKKKFDDYGYLERVPLKGIRKSIAGHMRQAVSESALVTNMEDIDVSKLWKLRDKEKKKAAKKGVKLTFLPFIARAVVLALKENPIVNSVIKGEEIIIKKYYNIGIATETEVGLMVPVVKIAENKKIMQMAKEIEELAKKARKRKIDIMDLKGGTFTITNYGSVGGTYGTPIVNFPESAILGLGRIFDRVVMGKLGTKNTKILPVSLTFDHRVLDGAQAVRFLESLRKFLEEPDHLLKDL